MIELLCAPMRSNNGVAVARQHEIDFLGLRAKRRRHAGPCLLDALGDARACDFQFLRQLFVRAGNRLAQPVRVADDGLTLRGEFVDQGADAAFVIAVGAFEVCHLGAQNGFQFAGSGERAFDAVAHGGDFAADRLRQRHDLLGRNTLGFRQPDGDLLHRARSHAHLLRTARKARRRVEEGDRAECDESEKRRLTHRQRPLPRSVKRINVEAGDAEPREADKRCNNVRAPLGRSCRA